MACKSSLNICSTILAFLDISSTLMWLFFIVDNMWKYIIFHILSTLDNYLFKHYVIKIIGTVVSCYYSVYSFNICEFINSFVKIYISDSLNCLNDFFIV